MEGSGLPDGLDHHDLCRAFACALAVTRRDVFARYSDAFTLDPERQFEEVYFSPLQDEQQFIVAHAKDAVFFGFMGTKVLADYACDMMIDKITLGFYGSYHKGIYHRSRCFLGLLGGKFLQSLLGLKKRIIFCGHSLGGAVGHMVLTRLLLEDEFGLFRAASKNMRSIAFGAPHFCDKLAAATIEKSFPGQFFTFVNECDPVPRLLHDLPRTIQTVSSKIKDVVRSRTRVELLGGLSGSLLYFFATGKVVDLDDPSDEPVCELRCNSWEKVENKVSDAKEKGSVYSPVGTFLFLRQQSPRQQSPRLEVLNSTSEAINGWLSDISLEDKCFADHRCGSYLRALLENSLILEGVNRGPQDARKFYHKATSRQPEVDLAICQAVEGEGPAGGVVIEITGKNLFLLREVALNNVQVKATEVVESTPEKLVILHPLSLKEGDAANKRASSLTLVVKTPFGDCTSLVVEEYHQDDQNRQVGDLLRKLVLVLVLLAKLGVLPPGAELEGLEDILRNFGSTEMPLTEMLTARGLKCAEVAREIANLAASNIVKPLVFKFNKGDRAANFEVIEDTLESAKQGVGTTFKATLGGAIPGIALGSAAGAVVSALATGSIAGAYSFARTSLVCVYNVSGWFVCKAIDTLEPHVRAQICKYFIGNYDGLLEAAVKEVRLWRKKSKSSRESSGSVNRQSYTENDLVEQVKDAKESFRAMLRDAFSKDRRTMRLTLFTEYLSSATDECIGQFLRKIYAIVEIKDLYVRFVADECFVALVGPEDVGKTSFIREVDPESVPQSEVGIDVHTVEVKPYKLEEGLTLVDFPGENGVSGEFYRWFAAFIAMPSIIVLLLNFDVCQLFLLITNLYLERLHEPATQIRGTFMMHDIKQDQIDLYKSFQDRIRSPILVVFNQVDKHVEKRTMRKYSDPSYFSGLRQKAAEKLKCCPNRVFYACLSPEEEKMAAVKELMKVGVVDVQGFMKKLREFKNGTRNSFKLK